MSENNDVAAERIEYLRNQVRTLYDDIDNGDIVRHLESAAISLDIALYKITEESVVSINSGKGNKK